MSFEDHGKFLLHYITIIKLLIDVIHYINMPKSVGSRRVRNEFVT